MIKPSFKKALADDVRKMAVFFVGAGLVSLANITNVENHSSLGGGVIFTFGCILWSYGLYLEYQIAKTKKKGVIDMEILLGCLMLFIYTIALADRLMRKSN